MFSATVRTTCTVLSPAGARRARALEALAGHLVPAPREVVVDVGHRGPAQARCRRRASPGAPARRCALESKRSPASSVRSMPLTKASSPSMVIVFSWWQWKGCSRGSHLAADARAARERADGLLDLLARRVEGRHRRAGPHEHAHVDALGQLGQQRADDDGRLAADELEVRRQVPAGDVHEVGARPACASAMAGSASAPSTRTSSEQPCARRRIAGRPQAVVGRLERPLPAQAPQAAAVLGRHGGLDRVADGGVGVAHEWNGHSGILPARVAACLERSRRALAAERR